MQHAIGRCAYRLSAHLTVGWSEQGEQLRRPATNVFVRLASRLPLSPPGGAGLGDRLIGSGLVLTPNLQTQGLPQPIGAFDQVFLGVASGSTTVRTVPSLRLRWAVPVAHQVRFCW